MSLLRSPQSGSYRLTRKFAIGSALVICLAGIVLGYLSRTMAVEQLELMAQHNNVALTQAFANGVWPRFAPFVGAVHTSSGDEIVAHPETQNLGEALKNLMSGTAVLKVKLYDLGGLTVFSTDPKQIGSDYSQNPRFLTAFNGGTASQLEFRETFNAFGADLENRWVLSSYVPIRAGGEAGAIEGVAEIYTDVTSFYAHVQRVESVLIGVVAVAFGIVFVLLLGMVGWADRKIQRQHRRTLELTASSARATAANTAKSEFLANMSHELRTPWNSIIGFSEMIRDEAMGPVGAASYKDYAAHIHTSGTHLLELLSNVKDLVRIESGKMAVEKRAVDVVAVVREAVDIMQIKAAEAQIALSFDADCEQLEIASDATKIRQIVLNLVANGIKFTADGGSVDVKITQSWEGEMLRCVIADTGIGMREQDIPLALASFEQVDGSLARQFDGTGLGLSLSRKLAQLLGGDIGIESSPGKGTSVIVSLPRTAVVAPTQRGQIAA